MTDDPTPEPRPTALAPRRALIAHRDGPLAPGRHRPGRRASLLPLLRVRHGRDPQRPQPPRLRQLTVGWKRQATMRRGEPCRLSLMLHSTSYRSR